MEPWREELYHSELYHYGVKGMKWGKHKTPFYKYSDSSSRGRVEKALGMYTESRKNNPYPNSVSVGYKKDRKGFQLYLHNTGNNTYFKSGETNTGRSRGAFKTEYADDGARYSVNVSTIKRSAQKQVKDIGNSVNKAKSWISSRPGVAKKKVSELKDKIAWAEKGKQSISSIGSSKSKKSSVKVESVFPTQSQNPKKHQEQKDRYKKSVTKKSTGKKTVKDYGVSGTFRTYSKRK